jgi:hypothetical protein
MPRMRTSLDTKLALAERRVIGGQGLIAQMEALRACGASVANPNGGVSLSGLGPRFVKTRESYPFSLRANEGIYPFAERPKYELKRVSPRRLP